MANHKNHTCDSRESLVQLRKVAGATRASRWCNSGESLVRLRAVAGATLARRGGGRKKFQKVRTHRRS